MIGASKSLDSMTDAEIAAAVRAGTLPLPMQKTKKASHKRGRKSRKVEEEKTLECAETAKMEDENELVKGADDSKVEVIGEITEPWGPVASASDAWAPPKYRTGKPR